MSSLLKFAGFVLIGLLIACEIYLLKTYWSIIIDTTNFASVGPLITSIFTPAVAILTIVFSYVVISVQFERNRELEKVKQRLGEVYKRESDAYFKIWNAISVSFRLLSELQRGSFDAASPEKIDTAFGEAEHYVFIISVPHQNLFYSYWQKVVELLALIPAAATPAAKLALWATHMPRLYADYEPIRDQFRNTYLAT